MHQEAILHSCEGTAADLIASLISLTSCHQYTSREPVCLWSHTKDIYPDIGLLESKIGQQRINVGISSTAKKIEQGNSGFLLRRKREFGTEIEDKTGYELSCVTASVGYHCCLGKGISVPVPPPLHQDKTMLFPICTQHHLICMSHSAHVNCFSCSNEVQVLENFLYGDFYWEMRHECRMTSPSQAWKNL